MKYFKIYGERCSGTNFLEHAIKKNFNLKYIPKKFGNKHFFGFNNFEDSDDVLFIGIVRNPYKWINSLYKNPWHINYETCKNINNFLNREFYSYYPNNKRSNRCLEINYLTKSQLESSNKEILNDRHIYTKKRYKNIFELREVKIKFLLYEMPNKVKNYIFIKYEDLRDNYQDTLIKISNKFNLKINSNIVNINNYKGRSNKFKEKLNIIISNRIINSCKNFNKDLEKIFNYI